MKFELNAKECKNAADRAMAVISKKPSLPVLDNLKITSGDGAVIISASNLETFVDITVAAHIIEPGEVYVNKASLVKVYGLSDYITIEANDKIFNVKNGKKCCEVATVKLEKEEYPKAPVIDDNVNRIFKESEKDLINAFISMDCIRAKNSPRPILEGFNINGAEKRIAACDGFRLAVKRLNGEILDSNFNITIPGDACVNLKKIGNNKRDYKVNVFYGKPSGCTAYFVFFKGVDFTYCCRVLEGEYLNISSVMKINKTYSFEICPEELENIAKEYSKEKDSPMYIIKNDNNLYTTIISTTYQTADMLESAGKIENMSDGYCFCANPAYVKEAMSLFKEDKVLAYGDIKTSETTGGMIAPICFENEEYTALVLPVRATMESVKNRIEFISKLQR